MLLVKLLVAADDELADPLKLPARREEKKNLCEMRAEKNWVVVGGWVEEKIFTSLLD